MPLRASQACTCGSDNAASGTVAEPSPTAAAWCSSVMNLHCCTNSAGSTTLPMGGAQTVQHGVPCADPDRYRCTSAVAELSLESAMGAPYITGGRHEVVDNDGDLDEQQQVAQRPGEGL